MTSVRCVIWVTWTKMQPAYVLHTRAYRETSLLVELLTQEHGRVALVARGAKRGKSKRSNLLQLFTPLNVTWFGNGDLVTLTNVELAAPSFAFQGQDAICGLYINELMIKLLQKWDPCSAIYANYCQTLAHISKKDNQIVLRKFEKELLRALGYELQLTRDAQSGAVIKPDLHYMYDPSVGPIQVKPSHVGAIQGASILALHADNYLQETLADIKRLMRVVLSYHLGNRKIMTRELFV